LSSICTVKIVQLKYIDKHKLTCYSYIEIVQIEGGDNFLRELN